MRLRQCTFEGYDFCIYLSLKCINDERKLSVYLFQAQIADAWIGGDPGVWAAATPFHTGVCSETAFKPHLGLKSRHQVVLKLAIINPSIVLPHQIPLPSIYSIAVLSPKLILECRFKIEIA